MKHVLTGIALTLALASSGAVAAAGGGGGAGDGEGQVVANATTDRANTERALCLRTVKYWYEIGILRMTSLAPDRVSPPSYECRAHYLHNTSDGAFGRSRAMPTRDDYNNWLLLRDAYRKSDAMRDVWVYPRSSSVPEWFGAAAAERNAEREKRNRARLLDGWVRVSRADPFDRAPTFDPVDASSAATVKCGAEYADAVGAIKNAATRHRLRAEYDKNCGPEAMAARAKAAADAAAARAAEEPRIIALSELEQMEPVMGAHQPDNLNHTAKALLNPELKTVVFGVETAPQMVIAMDSRSQATWKIIAREWPGVREGKLSIRIIPIAVLKADSDDIAALLATDQPNRMMQAWVLASGGGQLRQMGEAVQELAERDSKAAAVPAYVAPSAEALAAAKAAVARNTELLLKAGIVGLPVAYYKDPATSRTYVADMVPRSPTGRFFEFAPGFETGKDLTYEQSLRDQLGTALPKDSKKIGALDTKICNGAGECWMAEGKRGWFD